MELTKSIMSSDEDELDPASLGLPDLVEVGTDEEDEVRLF